MLWQNRDPLVRASALQLLAGLMNTVHTASQLFNAIAMAPSDLCHTLLQCITNRDESCLVREQACIAFYNMLKNCSSMTFQCVSAYNLLLKYREDTSLKIFNFFTLINILII